MGMIKTQRGHIEGVNKHLQVDEPKKSNGQNQDLVCPHNAPINACSKCMAQTPSGKPEVDDHSDE